MHFPIKKKWIFLSLFLLLSTGLFGFSKLRFFNPQRAIVKVGVIHSLTGTMALSEKSVADATLLAIEELNQENAIPGKKIVPLLVDGASDPKVFAREAERLILEEKVSVVFGCWTSACRKTVKPIFEKYDHLLFYPVQYEGLEESRNIIYTGAAPNQQIIPAVSWAFKNLGKRFFLVGSDYVFPHTANAIMKDMISILGGKVTGETYLPLGAQDAGGVLKQIQEAKPDVILNTINGDTNLFFFRALKNAGGDLAAVPVMSFSLSEIELQQMDKKFTAGHYAAWNYFQSIDSPENKKFIENFQRKYGKERVIGDPMEAAYFGVKLWAQAARAAGTTETKAVLEKISNNQSLLAPEGIVSVDDASRHTWKTVRIGRILPTGQFEILWTSFNPIRPVPFPISRSAAEWKLFLDGLYNGWQKNWEGHAAGN